MNGIHFYQEFRDTPKRKSAGTVVANSCLQRPVLEQWQDSLRGHCRTSVDQANSVVCGGSVSLDYLHEKCRRVREANPRTIHPALFERLDKR